MHLFLTCLACVLLSIQTAYARETSLHNTESQVLFSLEASRAANIGRYSPNVYGVFPVRLRWQRLEGARETSLQDAQEGGFHVYRSARADWGFERISPAPVENEQGGFFVFIDENPVASPGKPYYYRVSLSGEFSETVMGYGALSHESYWQEYSKTAKSSYQKMTIMNKPGALNKLGLEKKQGSLSGSLEYHARIAGLGARIIMRYERYADFYTDNSSVLGPYFILTGNVNTSCSITMNGTMDGTVNVSGMYPGRIYYDKIIVKRGVARGGTYGVEPDGFPRAELEYSIMDWIAADQ